MNQSSNTEVSTPIKALAYDLSLSNKRPIFAMHQVIRATGSSWQTERSWLAVNSEIVASELAKKLTNSFHVSTEISSLGERGSADFSINAPSSPSELITRLSSKRSRGIERERKLVLQHPILTLATLPLFVAENWDQLRRGQVVPASYLVLKVQRVATVDLQWIATHKEGAHVTVTPRNLILRAIFGSTRLFTKGAEPVFVRQDGLLDPRDTKRSGRWKEYLGVLEFETPWDLTLFKKNGDTHELA